jgi:hypothetical protein
VSAHISAHEDEGERKQIPQSFPQAPLLKCPQHLLVPPLWGPSYTGTFAEHIPKLQKMMETKIKIKAYSK